MISRTICIDNTVMDFPGVCARFVQKACEFDSSILIKIDNKKFINGKSYMGMLGLNIREGMQIHLTSEGADEEQAAETLSNLFQELTA